MLVGRLGRRLVRGGGLRGRGCLRRLLYLLLLGLLLWACGGAFLSVCVVCWGGVDFGGEV